MSKPRSSDVVGLYVVLASILFTICTLVNSLIFNWSCAVSLFRAALMVNGCFLLLLFVAWTWPKLMWLGAWLRWFRYSWWWEKKSKSKKDQLAMNKRNLIWLLITIVIALVMYFVTFGEATGQGTGDINYWHVTFYRVEIDTAEVTWLEAIEGDTISLEWMQPLASQKYEDQPDPVFDYSLTGEYHNIRVLLADVLWESLVDTGQVRYGKEVDLTPGWWQVAIQVYDTADNKSKYSDPSKPFKIKGAGPMRPVWLQIIIESHD